MIYVTLSADNDPQFELVPPDDEPRPAPVVPEDQEDDEDDAHPMDGA